MRAKKGKAGQEKSSVRPQDKGSQLERIASVKVQRSPNYKFSKAKQEGKKENGNVTSRTEQKKKGRQAGN